MHPLARTTVLANYADLVRSLGGDPPALMRAVGLDPAAVADPDRWLPVAAGIELLEHTAAATGCPDLGLRLAELSRFSNLGPIGLVAREELTVRSVLDLLIQQVRRYNEALRAQIVVSDGPAALWVDLALDSPADRRRQGTDMLVGVCHRLVGRLLGPGRQPVGVTLTRTAPDDPAPYHRVLGPAVTFRQPRSGVLLHDADLAAPNTLADPRLRPYTRQFLKNIDAAPGGVLIDRARRLVEELLPTGRCSLERLARAVDLDARTLQRRLAEHGEGYSSLLDSVRTRLARRYVADSERPLTEIAALLGFSCPGTFSRWFRDHFGTSPSAWRTQHAQPGSAARSGH